jgi:hypothetical protein
MASKGSSGFDKRAPEVTDRSQRPSACGDASKRYAQGRQDSSPEHAPRFNAELVALIKSGRIQK